jgi:hypothetical protein
MENTTDLSQLVNGILAALLPIMTGLLGWLSIEFKRWITAKIDNELLKNALIQLEELVRDVVQYQMQTTVARLKESNIFDENAGKAILSESVTKINVLLGDSARKYLVKQFGIQGDLKPYIETRIEAAIYRDHGECK